MPTDAYVPEEWAIAKRPNGGWVLLGAPAAGTGQSYRVVWPISPDLQSVVDAYGEDALTYPEFAPVLGGIARLVNGLKSTGEYTPEPAFDLGSWVVQYEAGAS